MKSLLSDVNIPNDISCSDFLLKSIREHAKANKIALIDSVTGKELSYRQLEKDVVQLSSALWQHGLRKGDVLCIVCPNCCEYPTVILSTLTCGATVTTASPGATGDEIKSQLSDTGAKYIVIMPAIADKIKMVVENYVKIKLQNVIVIGDVSIEGFTSLDSLMHHQCPPVPHVSIQPQQDIAAIPYSSGTTGLRKGVMRTHYNLVATICQFGHPEINIGAPLVGRNTLLCVLPFFHIYGLVVILLRNLVDGERMVVMTKFQLDAYLKIIEHYKVTLLHVVPPIVLTMTNNRELCQRHDLSSVKIVICGAAPLKKDSSDQFKLLLPGVLMKQGYGSTEANPLLLSPVFKIKPGSVGLLAPNTECKVVNVSTEQELGPHEVGELLVKGPQMMKGYLNNPGATAAVFRDGWMRTGDLAKYDEEGYFYIVDRIKELIKYKGYQVAPAYLEEILLGHPAIADAAVIGIDDAVDGELPCACVVTVTGADVTEAEIVQFVQDRVSHINKLRGGVKFVSSIPKSPSGKILHRFLKQRFANQSKKNTSAL